MSIDDQFNTKLSRQEMGPALSYRSQSHGLPRTLRVVLTAITQLIGFGVAMIEIHIPICHSAGDWESFYVFNCSVELKPQNDENLNEWFYDDISKH